jgi:hypothetical protein
MYGTMKNSGVGWKLNAMVVAGMFHLPNLAKALTNICRDVLKLERIQREKQESTTKDRPNSLRQSSIKSTSIGHRKTPSVQYADAGRRSEWEKHVTSLVSHYSI